VNIVVTEKEIKGEKEWRYNHCSM